jgi:hypothetical protein
MFADYRVPQILHHLGVLVYPSALLAELKNGKWMDYGSTSEVSIRSGGVIGVEILRQEITQYRQQESRERGMGEDRVENLSSALLDFWLWEFAKKVEGGTEVVAWAPNELVPPHRTRSIWY